MVVPTMQEKIVNFSDRSSLIEANALLISQLQNRLKMKRWRVQEGESLKVSYYRVLIQALECQNRVLKDVEVDQLKQDIEELKELMKSK